VTTTRALADLAFAGGTELLPKENPATLHAVDARRWITVYAELVRFKDGLIERLMSDIGEMTPEARAEVSGTDLRALAEQRERYRARLESWHRRHWELEGLAVDRLTREVHHRGKSVVLTGRELSLLLAFLASPGTLFTSQQLARDAWGSETIAVEEVRTYIARLRARLVELGSPCMVQNTARRGYALRFPDRKGGELQTPLVPAA
jgi:hypothetical protein